ncbi:MAG: hypothetical protein R2874_10240 [Desulfobacterales bacterium]
MFSKTVRIQIPSYDIDRSFDNRHFPPTCCTLWARYQTISLNFTISGSTFPEDETAVVSLVGAQRSHGLVERIRNLHEMVPPGKNDGKWLITGFPA